MALDRKTGTAPREFKIIGTRPARPDGIDKVTGRARFGADMSAPGMLVGRVLRSPHAHARIKSIDSSAAEALSGVHAVVTRADFPAPGEDVADILDNCMAGEKALYDGHAVAAVAASSAAVARQALKLIKVEYEPLPHVTDVDAAMAVDAPALHEGRANETVPDGHSPNVMARHAFGHGDIEAGLAQADRVLERSYRTEATHQGYIEPHACLASMGADGQADLWCCTQGHYMVRNTCAAILGITQGQLRVTASEIGGGFGGKTTVFLEPVALMLAKKTGRPVKMVMSRAEVLRATGPTSSSSVDIRLGMTSDGRITAGFAELRYQGGAYPGAPVDMGAMSAFAPYDLENVRTIGWDAVTNRPKAAAYRAPGAPMADLCRRKRDRRTGARSGPRPARRAPEERRARGHAGLLWADLSRHRPRGDAAHRPGPPALVRTAWPKSGARGRMWFLVQFRRRYLREPQHHAGRHGEPVRRQPRYRRVARVDVDDGCRGTGHPL